MSRVAGTSGSAASTHSGVHGLAARRMRSRVAIGRVIGRDRLTADDVSSLHLDFGHVEPGQVCRRGVLHPESVDHLVFSSENGEWLLHLFPTGIAQPDEISLTDDLAVREGKNANFAIRRRALYQQTQLFQASGIEWLMMQIQRLPGSGGDPDRFSSTAAELD